MGAPKWSMPPWMRPYAGYISILGRVSTVENIEECRNIVNTRSTSKVDYATMVQVVSQTSLLEKLRWNGLLKESK